MLSEKFREGLFDLSIAKNPNEALIGWLKLDNDVFEKNVVISLNEYNKSVYPPNLSNIIHSNESHLIPYFESEYLYFINKDLLADMITNDEKPLGFKVDYSIMLDTNYASYLDDFVKGNWNSISNEVFTTIDVLLRHDFQYDYLFYTIENYINSFASDNTDKNSNKKIRTYENLVNLELFKSIDTTIYQRTGKIDYRITKDEAMLLADQIYNGILNSSSGKEMMNVFLPLYKNMVLLLIGIFQIKFSDKSNASIKMRKLFDYSHEVIGVYLERELMIAHKYFCKTDNVKILSKINKGMKTENLLQIIENIALDFTVPRVMEFFLARIGGTRFFIPFFLTNDRRLRELLRLFAVKGIIFNSEESFQLPISRENSHDYYLDNNLETEQYFSDTAIEEREYVYLRNRDENFIIIEEEYKKLIDILTN